MGDPYKLCERNGAISPFAHGVGLERELADSVCCVPVVDNADKTCRRFNRIFVFACSRERIYTVDH